MSNNAKILWNTQKTQTKHALRHFKKFLKIRFLAEKSGSRLRCRIMLKYHETPRKHHLFWFSTCFDSQQLTSNGEMSWTTYTIYDFSDDLHWPEPGILLESTVKPLTSSHPKCWSKVASQKGWPVIRGSQECRPKNSLIKAGIFTLMGIWLYVKLS